MGEFQNQIAIVTGGANGVGKQITRTLVECGCKVAIFDIKDEEGEMTAQEIGRGGKVVYFHCDVSSTDELKMAFTEAVAHFGKVDILVNNAGIPVRNYIEDITPELWDSINAINMKAVFFLSKLAAEHMRAYGNGRGRIVNISSIRSIVVDDFHPGYNITKAGVNAITRNFAVRYAKWGITTNALALGIVITPMTAHYLDEPENLKRLKSNPMGRLFEASEVANVVAFLASDKASAVNGQIIGVDGGGALNRAAHQ